MAEKELKGRFLQKTDTTENWEKAKNFKPYKGEIVVYQDDKSSKIKIGDGTTVIGQLPFIAGEGGGSGVAGKTYVNVASLPKDNIDENIAYRVLEGTFVAQKRFRYDATCYTVAWADAPTGTGESALKRNGDDLTYVGYYNINNNEAYAYISQETKDIMIDLIDKSDLNSVAKAAAKAIVNGLSVGWRTFENFISLASSAVGISWGGIAYTLEEITNENALYIFIGAKTYCRNKGIWTSGDYLIGRRGTDSDAEVFNDLNNVASAPYAHAEGYGTEVRGAASHAEGYQAKVYGTYSHAEGLKTIAGDVQIIPYAIIRCDNYRVEGGIFGSGHLDIYLNSVENMIADGIELDIGATGEYEPSSLWINEIDKINNKVTIYGSPEMAQKLYQLDYTSVTVYLRLVNNPELGILNYSGNAAHAEGGETQAAGQYAHAEGYQTVAEKGWGAHAEGAKTRASANYAHAEGLSTSALGDSSHAEGQGTKAQAIRSHAEGHNTEAKADSAHAGGKGTIAAGVAQTAIGKYNIENNSALLVVGNGVDNDNRDNAFVVNADGSAEVYFVDEENSNSVVNIEYLNTANLGVGKKTTDGGEIFNSATLAKKNAHAEGRETKAYGEESHAEGLRSTTGDKDNANKGKYAHAEGYETIATGMASHAEGCGPEAKGDYSHAGGLYTVADGYVQTAVGRYNKAGTNSLFVVGDGTGNPASGKWQASTAADAFAVNKDGTITTGKEDYVLTKSVDTSAKAAEFSSLFASATGEVSSFLFFTDPHFFHPENNKRNMDSAIKYLQRYYEETPTSFVVNGGDMLQAGNTKEQACQKLGYADEKLRTSFDRYYYVFGNHDNNYQGAAYPGNQNTNHADKLSTEQVRNLCMRDQEKTYYSFLDNTTRYYVFDTGIDWDAAVWDVYRKEQTDWFAKELLAKDDAHNVIIAHQFFYSELAPNILSSAIRDIAQAYNNKARYADYDFSSTIGTVHFYLAGHNHTDRALGDGSDGAPPIITTQHAYASSWSEPTFDLVLADYAANKLHLVRVGAGESRTVDIVPSNADADYIPEYKKLATEEYVNSTKPDIATHSAPGLVRIGQYGTHGININADTGLLTLAQATEENIDMRAHYKPITPNNLDYAVKSGLSANTLEWTDEEKASAREQLGIESNIFVANPDTAWQEIDDAYSAGKYIFYFVESWGTTNILPLIQKASNEEYIFTHIRENKYLYTVKVKKDNTRGIGSTYVVDKLDFDALVARVEALEGK